MDDISKVIHSNLSFLPPPFHFVPPLLTLYQFFSSSLPLSPPVTLSLNFAPYLTLSPIPPPLSHNLVSSSLLSIHNPTSPTFSNALPSHLLSPYTTFSHSHNLFYSSLLISPLSVCSSLPSPKELCSKV